MKKKFNLTILLDNNRFVMVFSLVMAILLYIIVAVTTSDTTNYVIQNVPVNMELQSAALSNLGLYVVDGVDYYVDITINGPRTVVPRYNADSPELATTARIVNVTGPGTYPFPLIAAYSDLDNLPFSIVSYSPYTIPVTLDRRQEKTLTVEAVSKGPNVPPDYYMKGTTVNPFEVSVTGPQTEVSKIVGAEVSVDLTEPLQETKIFTLPIVLRDAQGEIIDPDDKHLTLSATEAQMIITVYKQTGLPLEIDLLSTPKGFPVDELWEYMSMSVEYVLIAGPAGDVDPLTEFHLGYINLRELSPNATTNFNYQLDLEALSDEEIVSVDNISEVWVNFDLTEFDTMHLNLTEIQALNVPNDKEVNILSTRIDGVEFVGLPEVLEELTADDVVVEIDFSDRELSNGQQNYPVKISVPGKGLVWALGNHSVIIQVEEK